MKVKKSAANATIRMEYRMAKFVTDWKSGDTKNSSGKEAKEIHNCTQIQTQKYLLLEPDPGHKEQFPSIIAEAAKI